MVILSVAAAVVSIIISGFAIWLSVTFYRMSSQRAEDIKKSSNQIDSTVSRLESLFDKLYSDTFSMMKDTVTDMRKHIWKAPQEEDEKEKEINSKLVEKFSAQIEKIVSQQAGTSEKVDQLTQDLEKVMEQAVKETRLDEKTRSRKELKEKVLMLVKILEKPSLIKIADALSESPKTVASTIFDLGHSGELSWSGDPASLNSDSLISLSEKNA